MSEDEKKYEFNKIDEYPEMVVSFGSTRTNKTASWRNFKPVINEDKCIGCGICWKYCPEPAIEPSNPPKIIYDYCKGCGICITECPVNAIDKVDEKK